MPNTIFIDQTKHSMLRYNGLNAVRISYFYDSSATKMKYLVATLFVVFAGLAPEEVRPGLAHDGAHGVFYARGRGPRSRCSAVDGRLAGRC